jgi:dienelactone hydrolase
MKPHSFFLLFSLLLWCEFSLAKLPVRQTKTPYASTYVFSPNDHKPHPGVVLLHGSEGGSVRNMWVHALLLAESGFTVMTYCWWDCGRDVRSEPFANLMADIEIKDVVDAMEWFQKTELVQKNKGLAVYGISKGAELAMVLASLSDQPAFKFKLRALVAHSPTDVIEKGSNINWLDSRCWVCKEGVKECSYQQAFWSRACGKIDGDFTPADRDSLPMWRWQGTRLKLNSRIEIEKFTGAILITAGDNDTDWSSDQGRVARIESALKKAGRKAQVRIFPGEEHSFSLEAEQKRKALVDQFLHQTLK